MTDLEPKSFADMHPLVISTDDDLPPLRFRSLACAARTALFLKRPIVNESTGHVYSLADCNYLIPTGTWQ